MCTFNSLRSPYVLIFFIAFLISPLQAQMIMDDCAAHPEDEILHTEHCAVMALVPMDMATHISVNDGSWFSPATWNTGTVPGIGAMVLVDSGFMVEYDGIGVQDIAWLRVRGSLHFSHSVTTQLRVTTIVVDPIGEMHIGTADEPLMSTISSTIIFPDNGPIPIDMDPFEFGKGLISHGHLEINGAYKKTFCAITKKLNAGAASIKLAETPTGWKIGDVIVVTGTYGSAFGDFASNAKFHDEELTITAISGKTIQFTNNATGLNTLQYEHKIPAGYGLKMYVANLTRNVQIISENHQTIPVDQRGHIMLMHHAGQAVVNATCTGLGRTNKDILATDPVVNEFGEQLSGGENVRGRYTLHVHRAGTNDPAAEPVLISGCAIVDPTSWGVVNHQSHVWTDNNVVFNYFGAAFVTEDGNELGRFMGNIAIKGRKAATVTDIEVRTANFDFGFEGNGFWIQSPNLEYQNNIVTSAAGDAYRVFTDDASMPMAKRLKIPSGNIVFPDIAGTDDSIFTAVVPLRLFNNNIAYNCNSAMSFWTHMLNSDNVGDFSTVQYDPYTHTRMSLVDNCKFWNMLAMGVSVKYSGQVHFRNMLLLGDPATQFAGSDWIAGNPLGGMACITSTVTGQMIYENCTVKGWKKGIVAGRTDDLQGGDSFEYPYRNTRLINGIYANNTYNIIPEEATDVYGASEFYKFPDYFSIEGTPTFSVITANTLPVADFAYIPAGGKAVRFDGILSSDADPGVTTAGAGNGISAYVWQFGDGTTGYGRDPVHIYTTAGTYVVTLKVYDSQGAFASMNRNVYVADIQHANVFLHSGFETGAWQSSGYTNSTRTYVDNGWVYKSNWQIVNGKAVIYLSDKWKRPLVQIVKNDGTLRGTQELWFQAKNIGIGAPGNDLIVEITGINGEFADKNFTEPASVQQWNNNPDGFTADVLFTENIGLATFNWQTFIRDVDLGTGYDYLMIKFYSEGVKVGPAEEQGVDNICLPCVCSVPGGLFEDELTATHAMLIWDNVGSTQYKVQYKTTTGGSWTTVTVENTFLELNALSANTSYTWKVQAYCDGVWTAYTTDKIFITPAAGTSCTSPGVLSTELITSNKATLLWNNITGATQYQVSYKTLLGLTWTTVNTTANSYQLTGLLPLTAYQWKVRSMCGGVWKEFTSTVDFITLPLRLEDSTAANSSAFLISPNPASEQVAITFSQPLLSGMLKLVSVTGQTIRQEYLDQVAEGNQVTFSLAHIPKGMYFVVFSTSDGVYAERLSIH